MPTDLNDLDTLNRARAEFPTLEHFAHFALAYKAPLPRFVEDVMGDFMNDFYDTAGANAMSMDRIEEARASVSRLVGVPPEALAFVKNTSEGINIIASGLRLEAGDEVVVSNLEHEANLLPWRRLASRGIELTIADGGSEGLIQKIGPRTRVVATSWVSYGTGVRFDIPAIAAACRGHGALVVVDAIQGVGVLNTTLTELGADVVACGGHKGLLGLAGAGFLYVREDWIPKIEPPYVSRFSFASSDKWSTSLELARDAHRFEYGNPNFLGIAVLKRTAEFIGRLGLDAIEARVRTLTTRLFDLATNAGLVVRTPTEWSQRAGIISFEVSDPTAVMNHLRENNILVSVKDDRYLRTACHFYNTEEEVDELVRALVDEASGLDKA